jgi:5-formyltetrahydrofolate cyclo-ligase
MRNAVVALCLFVSLNAMAGKNRKDVPIAPLPAVIVNAQKVFLTNGGGSDLAYDAFYDEMKTWSKYQIVGSPDQADLIIELAYRVEHGGTRVWSSTNSYDGTTQVHSRQIVDPQLVLTIYDAKSKNSLWSTIDHRRFARREKNREKETINSAGRLVDDLKTRVSAPQ